MLNSSGNRSDHTLVNGPVLLCFLILIPTIVLSAQSQTARKPTGARPSVVSPPTGKLQIVTGHPDSVVFINNVRHGSTGENGELNLPRVLSGSFSVRVRT